MCHSFSLDNQSFFRIIIYNYYKGLLLPHTAYGLQHGVHDFIVVIEYNKQYNVRSQTANVSFFKQTWSIWSIYYLIDSNVAVALHCELGLACLLSVVVQMSFHSCINHRFVHNFHTPTAESHSNSNI